MGLTIYPEVSGSGLPTADLLRSYLAATVTYNNTAALANTALSVTVAAGGMYGISLIVQSTSVVNGLLMDFAGTATIANFIGSWAAYQEDMLVAYLAQVTSAGSDFGPAGANGNPTTYTFQGSVEITDAGTFLLRGAQNAADASNTDLLRGSTLTLTRMN